MVGCAEMSSYIEKSAKNTEKQACNTVHILHFIYDYVKNPWFGGGGSFRTLKIYKELEECVKVDIMVGSFPEAKREHFGKNIVIMPLGTPSTSLLKSVLSYVFHAYLFYFKNRRRYDIIINDFSPYMPLIFTGSNVIYCVQNYFGAIPIRRYFILGLIPFFCEKMAFKLNRKFIVVSKYLSKTIRRVNPKCKVIVIPNGIDEDLLKVNSIEKNFILYLGRIDIYQKGLDILIKAFSLYSRTHPDVRLVIAGSGKDEKKLQNLIKKLNEKILILGRVSEDVKKKLLSECLFVVLPSRFEAQLIVSIEAFACGKPVIGNAIPALQETIIDDKTGILLKELNERELFRKMCSLTENRQLREKLGKNARISAQKYLWKSIAQTFLKYLTAENSKNDI